MTPQGVLARGGPGGEAKRGVLERRLRTPQVRTLWTMTPRGVVRQGRPVHVRACMRLRACGRELKCGHARLHLSSDMTVTKAQTRLRLHASELVRIRSRSRTSSDRPVHVSSGKDASGACARDRTRPCSFAHELGRIRGRELGRGYLGRTRPRSCASVLVRARARTGPCL